MSRILLVTTNARPVPDGACWWRLRLRKNDDGHLCATQLDVPPGVNIYDGEFTPWSGYLEYFDGRNDWSFPYRNSVTCDTESEPVAYDYPERLIITSQRHYLNVLDVTPPDSTETSQWLQLTPPGCAQYSDHWQKDGYWPRHREHWLPSPDLWYSYWQPIDYPRSVSPFRMG